MAHLRDPKHGCPWDLQQDFRSIAPHTIEEAYEVVDAIERGALEDLRDEAGDLLFQVVYYAQMARERGLWDFEDVASAVTRKMVDRHPHVFGTEAVDSADGMTRVWEQRKAADRARKAAAAGTAPSVLDDVPVALPAATRAVKLQKRAARVGFDWGTVAPILAKIEEELGELRAETGGSAPDVDSIEDELGDLLFAVVNLARHLQIDPERALRRTNAKFERRFKHIERRLMETGRTAETASLEDMEALWQEAKAQEAKTQEAKA